VESQNAEDWAKTSKVTSKHELGFFFAELFHHIPPAASEKMLAIEKRCIVSETGGAKGGRFLRNLITIRAQHTIQYGGLRLISSGDFLPRDHAPETAK